MNPENAEPVVPKVPDADCANCPLYAQPLVPSFGPAKADLVMIGEAPGREEVQQQRPFVGKSGKLINMVLAHHGIERDDIFVTNACLCRPPVVKGKQTPPNAKAMKACRPRLLREVNERGAKTILATGGVAAKSILDTKEGIKSVRVGGAKTSPFGPWRVIPTFHPAAALRSPDVFPSIVGDVQKALRIEVVWEPPKYKVVDDVEKAKKILQKQVESASRLALDIEVAHLREGHSLFTPDWLCIGISHRPGGAVVYTERVCKDKRFQRALRKHLVRRDRSWVYQNGKFDVTHLWSFAPEARVGEDTLLAHYALNEIKGTHDLEQLSAEFLGSPSYKQEARQWLPTKDSGLHLLPPEVLHRYNAIDVSNTHILIDELHTRMKADGVFKPYQELLIPASYSFALMEYHGVLLDREYLQHDIGDDVHRKQEEARAEIFEVVKELPFVTEKFCNSPKQVTMAFEAMYGLRLESTNEETLAPFATKGNPLAKAILKFRKVNKLFSTYVAGPLRDVDPDGRLRVNFKLHGTETGRTSSSPNIQNWPMPELDNPEAYNVRAAVVAPEGHSYMSFDYSGIEMVVMAYMSKDPTMLEAFRSGLGTHKPLARKIFGDDYSKRQYRDTKSVAFGTLYDETPGHLAHRLGITKKEATAIQRGFHDLYKEVKPTQREFRRQALEDGEQQSIFGRKRRFWLITGDNRHHILKEALNFPIQSAAHDLTLSSLNRLTERFDIQPHKPSPINFTIEMHDSLSAEVRDDYIDEAAHIVREVMEDTPLNEVVPTRAEASVGKSWGEEQEYIFAEEKG